MPPAGKISLEEFPSAKPIYMDPEDTFERLAKKVNRIVNKMYGSEDKHIPIRIWKCE